MNTVRPKLTTQPINTAKAWSWFRLVFTVIICLIFSSCLLPDGNVGTYEGQKIGSVYVTTENLLMIDSSTEKLKITIPTFNDWEASNAPGSAPRNRKRNLPSGTHILLESVIRKGYDSWNTGIYYVYDVTIRILDGQFANQTAEAGILFVTPDKRSWGDRKVYVRRVTYEPHF